MIPIVVQNQDVNLTKSFFDRFKPNELAVHGTFYTVQGEGPLAGLPAWFIRLGGCNFGAKDVACQFCDTSFNVMDSPVRTIESLCEEYEELCVKLGFAPVVVITGGEPLLQRNVEHLVANLFSPFSEFYQPGVKVQIETNGTQLSRVHSLLDKFDSNEDFTLVISPKTVKGRYVQDPSHGPGKYVYKFVVSSDPENPHHKVPDWAPRSRTYVSPMTVYKKPYQGEVSSVWDTDLIDAEATKANYAYAAKLSMEHGYRVSVQMHTFLNIA